MKKHIIISLIALLMPLCSSLLYGQLDERLERFQTQKIAYFTDKLQLTTTEAEKFWPVYNDYNNRKDKIEEESRSILRYLNRNSDNIAEKEFNESLDKYIQLQKRIHELFLEYHKKYLEILPPQKVARLYTTEVQFRAFLLNQIRELRQQKNPGNAKIRNN